MTSTAVFALPSAVSAAAALACGLVIIYRERFSSSGWRHLVLAASVFGWQFSLTGLLLSRDAGVATAWVFAMATSAAFVPAAQFHFSSALSRTGTTRLAPAFWSWLATCGFLAALVSTDLYIVRVDWYPWGPYPRYGIIGWLFLAFTIASIAACFGVYRSAMRNNPRGGFVWRRTRLLVVALATASMAFVDFLPALGIDVFPAGGVFASLGLVLHIYTTWRYRLLEITPDLASQQFMDTMTDGVMMLDRDGMVRLVNPAACEILGYRSNELLHGFPPPPVAAVLDDDQPGGEGGSPVGHDMPSVSAGPGRARRLPGTGFKGREVQYQRPGVGKRTLSVSLSVVCEGGDAPLAAVVIIHDVTAARAAEEQIHRLAFYDALTGLPNRLLLKDRFAQAIAWAERARARAAVLFLDLDRFKQINDTLGHDVGDLLLKAVAERVMTCVRESDVLGHARDQSSPSTLARLGGDEFILLLSPIDRGEDAAIVAHRIIQALAEPVRLRPGQEVVTGVSVGIALYPSDGEDADTLMKKADLAMYHAKESGRNTARFYDDVLNIATATRLSNETSLRRALIGHEFLLRYQPVVSARTGAPLGLDTQVFWNHPARGLLHARAFADTAEETGVALSLDDWVLRTACFQLRAWRGSAVPPTARIMVSIGALSLVRGNLVDLVQDALAQAQIDPSRLWLCLRRPGDAASHPHIPAVFDSLSEMGVHLVMDDFGTGRISVTDMLDLPIGMVRLEGDYLGRVGEDRKALVAARALLGLSNGLGIKAVACGVDRLDTARILREAGCEFQAGIVHAPAVPAEEVPDLFAQLEASPSL